MTASTIIARQVVKESDRVNHTVDIFGIHFPMRIEPYVYGITVNMAHAYNGGYWDFYSLSNGGFYMAPAVAFKSDIIFHVVCDNGFEGNLSADALGITACLYAYSHLSFGDSTDGFSETCAQQYHWLREYMLEHPEARGILGAID